MKVAASFVATLLFGLMASDLTGAQLSESEPANPLALAHDLTLDQGVPPSDETSSRLSAEMHFNTDLWRRIRQPVQSHAGLESIFREGAVGFVHPQRLYGESHSLVMTDLSAGYGQYYKQKRVAPMRAGGAGIEEPGWLYVQVSFLF